MSDTPAAAPPKKKGGMKKIIVTVLGTLIVLGAGVGGGVYAARAGFVGGVKGGPAEDPNRPKLVKKGEGKKAAAEGDKSAADAGVTSTSHAAGDTDGEPYETTYYQMDKEFTANLRDSPHFVQVGLALSTNYDERVVENVKNNEIPVRSAILMTLSDADENAVFTEDGKKALAERLKRSVNDVLIQKEGFGGIGNVYFTSFVVQ